MTKRCVNCKAELRDGRFCGSPTCYWAYISKLETLLGEIHAVSRDTYWPVDREPRLKEITKLTEDYQCLDKATIGKRTTLNEKLPK